MYVKLVIVGGEAEPATIRMRLPVIAGRGRQANLVVPHPQVSRMHCEIFEAHGALRARDLGSLNGTFVNDQRVAEARLLPGDTLSLGGIAFRVEYDLETAAPDDPQPGRVDIGDSWSAASEDLSDARTGEFPRDAKIAEPQPEAATEPAEDPAGPDASGWDPRRRATN